MKNGLPGKLLASFALNDLVASAEWETRDSEVWYSARYTGASSDGTIHFRVRYGTSRKPEPEPKTQDVSFIPGHSFKIPNLPMPTVTIPREWDVRIAPRAGDAVALAVWRNGEGSDDVELHFYVVTNSILMEIEEPEKAPERPIGFRSVIQERSE